MSPSRLPGTHCAIARSRDSRVASISAFASGDTGPMGIVRAESPHQPSLNAPKSMESMSPSLSTTSLRGMPWTTTSLTEVHSTAG